jgi:hypothetical protein
VIDRQRVRELRDQQRPPEHFERRRQLLGKYIKAKHRISDVKAGKTGRPQPVYTAKELDRAVREMMALE